MHHRAALLFVGLTLTGANQAIAQDPAAAVRKLATDYAAACSRGDAKAVAAFYTADAVNIEAGPVRSVGREAIEKKVAADYAGPFKGAKCTITVTSVRFPRPDVGLAEGGFSIVIPGQPTVEGLWINTMLLQGGKWLITHDMGMIKQ